MELLEILIELKNIYNFKIYKNGVIKSILKAFKRYSLPTPRFQGEKMESVKYIKEDDLKRIREVLKYKNKPVILKLINFGVNVALRISDPQKLKFEDISRNNKIILREQKTGKVRVIQLNKL